MRIICDSGKEFHVSAAETVIRPLNKFPPERFHIDTDPWESDRAWLFAKPGTLIVRDGYVHRIREVTSS